MAEEEEGSYGSVKDIEKLLKRLRKEMKQAAGKYNFERATQLRDQISQLERKELKYR